MRHFGMLLGLFLMMGGCARPVYPGDGTPVGVLLAPELASAQLSGLLAGTTLGELAEEGMHYWDQTGAKFLLIQSGESEPGGVVRVGFGDPGADAWGQYNFECGCIYLSTAMRNWQHADYIRTIFAHELGHAIGLDHITEDGVMYPILLSEKRLKSNDLAEYQRVWGTGT